MSDSRIVIVDHEGRIVYKHGLLDENLPMHSAAKPVQILPVYLLELDRFYHLEPKELAVMSSSHLAQDQHICALNGILEKTGLREEDMILNESAPMGRLSYQLWKTRGDIPRKLYNPCSGNHLALMLAQRALTGSVKRYEQPESAVQQMILELLKLISEFHEIPLGTDNCGIPLLEMPLYSIAVVYRNLVIVPERYDQSLKRAIQKNNSIMHQAPEMLEGDGCLSTVLTGYGELLAKTGKNNLLAMGIPSLKYGLAIQAPGADLFSVSRIAQIILKRIGIYDSVLEVGFESILQYQN